MTNNELEQWLRTTGETIQAPPEVCPGLYDRLKFITALLAEAELPSSSPALVFRNPEGRVCATPIQDECVVGRAVPTGLALADRQLSRPHFRVVCRPKADVIEDLNSRNGTYVNGARVQTQELLDGDIIEAGQHIFVFFKQAPEHY